jgi:hypothetical protein
MPEAEEVPEQVDLAIGVRPPRVLVDFLEQDQIRLVARDDVGDAHRLVSPIEPADAFVNVVVEDSQAHVDLEERMAKF